MINELAQAIARLRRAHGPMAPLNLLVSVHDSMDATLVQALRLLDVHVVVQPFLNRGTWTVVLRPNDRRV